MFSVKLANNITYDRQVTIGHMKGIELMRVYRMLTALERLRSAAPSHGLGQVLLGQRPPSPPQEISDLQFFDESLNESQKDAVRFALGAHEIALVHGPPGVMHNC